MVSELADMNTTDNISWLHVQQSRNSRAWDSVSLAHAKIVSRASQPTSASPWIDGAGGEDQVCAFSLQMS